MEFLLFIAAAKMSEDGSRAKSGTPGVGTPSVASPKPTSEMATNDLQQVDESQALGTCK